MTDPMTAVTILAATVTTLTVALPFTGLFERLLPDPPSDVFDWETAGVFQ